MKRKLLDYNAFSEAIQKEELVFLFGTGISSALTGKPYSWGKWISDGIDGLKNSAQKSDLKNKLEDQTSANDLVAVVGQVIEAAKADGTYDRWMQDAFESNRISNQDLVETLQKLVLSQVVFATTNYDLLLEKATGLSIATYENPDIVFPMLDRHLSTHILHIHGGYDSAHGIDNIVADQDQYDAVMDNAGAQFIQHILSTRTLVFVGCGKTTEDPNISRFIEFANKNLKMDRIYYFLCKEQVEGLPDHIVQIQYGDDYADLPVFLEEIAKERLKKKIVDHEIVGYTAMNECDSTEDTILQYHFARRAVAFCGRTEEMQALLAYLTDARSCLWWAITGQAGSGKSRLAMELLYRLQTTWTGFFLNDNVPAETVKNFKPFCNTVVVIDYVAGREREVAGVFTNLQSVFAKTSYKLRVLFLERDSSRSSGSWYSKLTQRMCGIAFEKFKKAEYSDQFMVLSDLDQKAVETLITEICETRGIDQYDATELYETYGKKFEHLKFRPLFVQLFVEAWIENDCRVPQYESSIQLLESLLIREQQKWLAAVDGDIEVCNAFVCLMVRANISGRMVLAEIPELYQDKWKIIHNYISRNFFVGKQKAEGQDTLINTFCQNIDSEHEILAPQFPDLIKEFMFMYYTDRDFLPEMMKEIWQNAPASYATFITRCLMDFPDQDFYLESMNAYKSSTTDYDVLIGRIHMLQNRFIQKNEDPKVFWNIIKNEHSFWSSIDESDSTLSEEECDRLAMIKITGLYKVVQHVGAWSFYDLTAAEEVVDEMLAVKGLEATSLLKKHFLQEHITELSRAGFFEEAEKDRKKLEKLMCNSADATYDSMLKMKNQNERMMSEILTGNFCGARCILMDMSKECNYENLESVHMLAHSCFNLDHLSMMFGEFNGLGSGLETIQKCERLYPNDQEIHCRRLGCQGSILQKRYFEKEIKEEELRTKLSAYEAELANMKVCGTTSDDALNMTWGLLKTLKINVAREEELQSILLEADSFLFQNPRLECVVATRIMAVQALYKRYYKTKIPHEEVEKLFQYLEQNPESESVRECFFEMLEQSEDAGKSRNYLNQDILREAISDARYNPIYGSGIPEIDDIFAGEFFDLETDQPYVRKHPKIGRNEPCPCGSGKKYKKCCGK